MTTCSVILNIKLPQVLPSLTPQYADTGGVLYGPQNTNDPVGRKEKLHLTMLYLSYMTS